MTLALILAFVPFPGSTFVARLIDTFIALPTFLVTLAFTFLYGSAGMLNGALAQSWVTLPVAIFGLTDRGRHLFRGGVDDDSRRRDLGAAGGPGALAPRRRRTQSLGIIGKHLPGPRHILVNYLVRHPIA